MNLCDIYLFCLWHQAKPWWRKFIDEIKSNYEIKMMFKSWFPNDMKMARRFYGNASLICGYERKLDGMRGEFIFLTCHDEKMNDVDKIRKLKDNMRKVRNIKVDYNLIHGSETLDEFTRQIKIIGELPWQLATHM